MLCKCGTWHTYYNHLAAERASARGAIKLLKYKWFGMWVEGGAKKKWRGEK